MTTEAILATHVAASIPSIPRRTAIALYEGDVSITVTFRPHDPIGSTEVVASIDLPDATALLNLLDATISRVIAYRNAYRQAMTANDQPARADDTTPPPLLPTPWYGWNAYRADGDTPR